MRDKYCVKTGSGRRTIMSLVFVNCLNENNVLRMVDYDPLSFDSVVNLSLNKINKSGDVKNLDIT